ncbi:hypothetical protein SLEP1_g3122 [Rubroshorea leprosula]|uniref:Retrovirus-related Pol polyprotein from transposon TNT 1-94-like beta-barrel domain-containing protein n=1 Tax=Rubroshorea leprosula TaxID=152421 RepID=A0AAV5HJE8_9ROSI|nr:hypothetical protein SLEP1_g3122 [Rubroshorea leprosula]
MKYSIELFDGKNDFALWQSIVKDVLTCQGLDAALKETKLAEVRDSDWSTIQKKAASQIRLALAPEMELYQLKMVEGTNIHKHLFDFNMMVTKVVNAGDILEEEEKALLLLASLPKSYKSLVQSMLVGKTTLVMKNVTSMLLENDKFLGEDDGANRTNALVMEHSRGRSNGRGGGGNRERSKSRPKKDYGEVYQETKGKGEANIVEENMVEVLACEKCDTKVEQNNQRWILDSTATMHVCNNPSEFGSLVRGELGKITVATGEKVNIEGIGDVCLNVHNGRAKILKNVRYVLKCSSNIIALSELTTRGCKYVRKQEWRKVYKGGRLVLHGRKNKHNIYVLEQHPKRRLNKTMRKMVWKPKGILVDGKEINKTKKKVSFNNEVVFDDGSRRCYFPSNHILVQN